MLSQLFSLLSRKTLPEQSTKQSSKASASSASLPAQSQEFLNNPTWIARAIDQIRADEGEVLHAYADHLGYMTIGVGRLIDKRKGGGISKDESEYLLRNDINTRTIALNQKLSWFNKLNDARKAVLLNMSFQLGVAGLLQFKTTLAKIEAGDYDGAATNMLKSKWASQTPNRANRMAEQMRTGKWQS